MGKADRDFSTAAKRSGEIFGGRVECGVMTGLSRPFTRSLGSDDSAREIVYK